jgi:hypothetical protein
MRYAALLVAAMALGLTGWVAWGGHRAEATPLVPQLLSLLPADTDPEAPGLVLALQPEDCPDALTTIGLLNRLRLGRPDAPEDSAGQGVVGLVLNAPKAAAPREDIRLVTGAQFPLVYLAAPADRGIIRHVLRLGWQTTPFLLGHRDGRVRFVAPLAAVDSTYLEALLLVLLR